MRQSKLEKILIEKFQVQDSKDFLLELDLPSDTRCVFKMLSDLPVEKFDRNVIKKFVDFKKTFEKPSMIYTPEYWMYRNNISYDEAIEKVSQYKTDKATSKKSFIKRHGEKKGLELFEKFQKTSAYSSSDEWFMDKYGDSWKEEKTIHERGKSKRCVEYWIKNGFTEAEAIKKVSEYQLKNSGVHREYYVGRGYSDEEIDVILMELNYKRSRHPRNTKYLREKYPDTWKQVYTEISEKYRKRMEELGVWIECSLIDDFKKYKTLANRYTNESLMFYGNLIEDLDLRSRDYHLDHKYSIKMGFINDIDAKIIGSIVNLEIVPAVLNSKKREHCSITKDYLLQEYKKFQENYEN